MSELTIRDARAEDKEAISEVTLAAYEQYRAISEEMYKRYKENILETLADTGDAQQFVAVLDGKIVGTVLLFPGGVDAYGGDADAPMEAPPEVRLLAVTPEARGHGVAKALMGECLARARESGAKAVGLHTLDFMAVAKKMYEDMGFVRVPERDFFPGIQVKGYEMALTTIS